MMRSRGDYGCDIVRWYESDSATRGPRPIARDYLSDAERAQIDADVAAFFEQLKPQRPGDGDAAGTPSTRGR